MRLKEPFRGLYLMGGHTIFHLSLLFASLIILWIPQSDDAQLKDTIETINQLRIAHGLDIFIAIIKFLGAAPHFFHKHRFSYRVLDSVKLFFYIGSVMYAIYHKQKTNYTGNDVWYTKAEYWILVELLVFFG